MPLDKLIAFLKKIVPPVVVKKLKPIYHWLWAFLSASYYRFPAHQLNVIFITGSKGKTTTAELINQIFEASGHRTALASTLRFKIFNHERRNPYKMSVPGRGILHHFLRQSVSEGCEVAIMEMTSQAVLDYRHKFLFPNVLIFTNLEPEHIEAHGSYENYLAAKLELATTLKNSWKQNKSMVANLDDKEGRKFINASFSPNVVDRSYGLDETSNVSTSPTIKFTYKNLDFHSPLKGEHNLKNILAAIKVAEFYKIPLDKIAESLKNFSNIPGRLEEITEARELGYQVYVDYAHTPESLRSIYQTFPSTRIIGVLGNAGGGRDTWKRAEMAKIAEEYCQQIILTDEDPYDEDPQQIVDEMFNAISDKTKAEIILDRRQAIKKALASAQNGQVVLITGKGTDPYIMRSNNEREAWDDASVVREELARLNN